jgi:hypothetical protein
MLLAYVSETHMPGRTDAAAIMRWAPAIEMKAYSAAAMTVTYIDRAPRIFPGTPMDERSAKAARRRYWAMLSLMVDTRCCRPRSRREAGSPKWRAR